MTVAELRERLRDYPGTAKVRFLGATASGTTFCVGKVNGVIPSGTCVAIDCTLDACTDEAVNVSGTRHILDWDKLPRVSMLGMP